MDQAVCIIIAAYKASATIGQAVASALAEPETAEVVVVDDASGDNTADAARAADDGSGRLKVLVQAKNGGPSVARNRAIAESSAPWIGILDADDLFMPGRLKPLLAQAQNADLIADDILQTDTPQGIKRSVYGRWLKAPTPISFAEFVRGNVTQKGTNRAELGFIKPIMRRSFLAAHAIAYREEMRLGEDFELYARALALGAKMVMVPGNGYVSVVRANSLSGQHSEADLQHLRDCDHGLSKLALSAGDRAALRQHYLSVDCRLQWRKLISAVKARNASAVITSFLRPWPVPLYLFKQLALQAYIRSTGQARP